MQPRELLHENCWINLQCTRQFHCCYKAGNSLISLSVFFYAASRCHNYVIMLPAICRLSGNNFVFQQDSALAHRATNVYCCVKKCQTFLHPTCGLQTAQISVLWIKRSGLSCSIASTRDKSIVWMNWNGDSSMSGVALNSRFLTRLLTSGEEDFEHLSTLK